MCKEKSHFIKMNRAVMAFQRFNPNIQKRIISSRQFSIIKKAAKIGNSGENHPNYGRIVSDETKRKISETKIGSKNPMFGNGKPLSEEHKRRIKESLNKSEKLKNRGDTWKKNVSAAQSKEIAFVSVETGKIVFRFQNCNEAAKFLGCNKSNITNALRTDRIVGKKLKTLPERCKVMYTEDYYSKVDQVTVK